MGHLKTAACALLLLVGGYSFAACARPAAAPPIGGGSTTTVTAQVQPSAGGTTATVNGVKIHYLSSPGQGGQGGQAAGTPVVLLHGFAETSLMWRPLIAALGDRHAVVAPDLRGAGGSDKPETGYDKKTLAKDIHALVQLLGYQKVKLVGHDIGLMVAYAYAAQYPTEVESIALMDAFLPGVRTAFSGPGVGAWKDVWLVRDLWHFHFYGETPLKLVSGRERIYLEHFWNDFAADRTRSVPEPDRQFYADAYAQPGGMRAGMEYFKAFPVDAADFGRFATTKLPMPMLVLTGEKASGKFLIEQGCQVASKVEGVVIEGSGHWLMEEAPAQVVPRLVAFLDDAAPKTTTDCAAFARASEVRLTPNEIDAQSKTAGGAGTSGVAGAQTSTLKGDPEKQGLYTIVLRIPANTRIEAHDHPDDRSATVVSGTWYFGFGSQFDEGKLKALPPGSFYAEPPNEPHFARTGAVPVVVQISGIGPTGTHYEGP
jgi:pimeloyl-ACP methyl ester carboxylesterase/quercetin dioxygenase-like cupin family protein